MSLFTVGGGKSASSAKSRVGAKKVLLSLQKSGSTPRTDDGDVEDGEGWARGCTAPMNRQTFGQAAIFSFFGIIAAIGIGILVLFVGNYVQHTKIMAGEGPDGGKKLLRTNKEGYLLTEPAVNVTVQTTDFVLSELEDNRALYFQGDAIIAGDTENALLDVTEQMFAETAFTVTVTFDNTVDGATKDGARSVVVVGVSASWVKVSEKITLTTTGSTAGTTSFVRVTSAYVADIGDYHGTNVAAIYIKKGSSTLFSIDAADGADTPGYAAVPTGYMAYIRSFQLSMASINGSDAQEVIADIMYLPSADSTATPQAAKKIYTAIAIEETVSKDFISYIGGSNGAIPEKSDIWVRVSNYNSQPVYVTFHIQYILIQ